MYLSREYERFEGMLKYKEHTEAETDYSENTLDTRNSLTTQKLAIMKTNITRGALYNKGRCGWGRRG